MLFLPIISYFYLVSYAKDDGNGTPHYLSFPINPCYLQYSQPIESLYSNQDGLLDIGQTYPICLCEKIVDKALVVEKYDADYPNCTKIPVMNCDSLEADRPCSTLVWFGSTNRLSGNSKYLKNKTPILLGCSIDNDNSAATVNVEIDEITEFDIGLRCDRIGIENFLNQKLKEIQRKGSIFYYRIMVTTQDVEHYCDKRILTEGTAMEIIFKCASNKPSTYPLAMSCEDHCKRRKSTDCAGDCDECDFQSDLHLVDDGLKQCMESAGFLIYWTQKSFPKNCGEDESNALPWALRFSFYEKVGGYTKETDYNTVVTIGLDGEETIEMKRGIKVIHNMGVLIGPRTMITAGHTIKHLERTDKEFIGIVSGGSDDSRKNLIEGRQKFHCWAQNFVLDVTKLTTTGWGKDPTKRGPARYLKSTTVVAISPYWGPSFEACREKCLCVHIAEDDNALCKGDSGTGLLEQVQGTSGVTRWQLVGVQAKVWGVDKDKPCSDYGTVHVLYGDIRKFKQWVCDHTFGICGGYYHVNG